MRGLEHEECWSNIIIIIIRKSRKEKLSNPKIRDIMNVQHSISERSHEKESAVALIKQK